MTWLKCNGYRYTALGGGISRPVATGMPSQDNGRHRARRGPGYLLYVLAIARTYGATTGPLRRWPCLPPPATKAAVIHPAGLLFFSAFFSVSHAGINLLFCFYSIFPIYSDRKALFPAFQAVIAACRCRRDCPHFKILPGNMGQGPLTLK